MDQEQIETTGLPEQNETASPSVIDLTELETKLTNLVEVLEAEQEQKQLEAENLAKEAENQAKEEAEAKLLAEKQAKEQAKVDAENQKVLEEKQQADTETVEEFRENLLNELKTINESIQEVKEIELHNQEMYEHAFPSIKQASDLAIIFLCLIPLIIVYKWLSSMFNSAFR